jgi:hypothetical protein
MLIGIPPFYNKNKHQMYYLIQHAPTRWPDKAKHGIDISDDAKDLVNKVRPSMQTNHSSIVVRKRQETKTRLED